MKQKLTREKLLECLLLSLNESSYLNYFPHEIMHHYSTLGYTAKTNKKSKIFTLLNVLSQTLHLQLADYELKTVKPKKPTKKELKEVARLAHLKLEEDKARFESLEQAWKDDKPRADKEMLDNALKAAENIFKKNQELKKEFSNYSHHTECGDKSCDGDCFERYGK